MPAGKFIVFEGGEGSGKSTLAEWFLTLQREVLQRPFFLTKEPGGDDGICKKIRELLLAKEYLGLFSDKAELLLFEAARAQHVEKVIVPKLAEGINVVCDRFHASTLAYQVSARRVCSVSEFLRINSVATGGLVPDFTFWIDVDPTTGLTRKSQSERTRFEAEKIEFHQKVRDGFYAFFGQFGNGTNNPEMPSNRHVRIDGNRPLKEVKEAIIEAMKEYRVFTP